MPSTSRLYARSARELSGRSPLTVSLAPVAVTTLSPSVSSSARSKRWADCRALRVRPSPPPPFVEETQSSQTVHPLGSGATRRPDLAGRISGKGLLTKRLEHRRDPQGGSAAADMRVRRKRRSRLRRTASGQLPRVARYHGCIRISSGATSTWSSQTSYATKPAPTWVTHAPGPPLVRLAVARIRHPLASTRVVRVRL